MTEEWQEKLVRRLIEKIRMNSDSIIRLEEKWTEDAEIVVVAYGITARVGRMAAETARASGIKAGFLRLITVWPFPEKRIRELAGQVKAFVVPEINYGQIVLEVERCASGKARAILVPHAGGGVHDPDAICTTIMEAMK
jgi:2-oxoglutarate ferredoxin oxidoreductase subunit alpha